MLNEIYIRLLFDFLALAAFMWTMWQEYRIRKKLGMAVFTASDLVQLKYLLERLNKDIDNLKQSNEITSIKEEVKNG